MIDYSSLNTEESYAELARLEALLKAVEIQKKELLVLLERIKDRLTIVINEKYKHE